MMRPAPTGRSPTAFHLLGAHRALFNWRPTLVALGLAGLLVGWRRDGLSEPGEALALTRAVALVLVVGAAFLLDDESWASTEASVLPLRWRTGLRVGVMLGAIMAPLAGFLAVLTARLGDRAMAGGVLVEGLALGLVLAAAATHLQRQIGLVTPGQFMLLPALGVVAAAAMLSQRWPMLPVPGPEWGPAHVRWGAVALVAAGAVAVALRDPAARPRSRGPWS